MACEQVREGLREYLAPSRDVEAHLRGCAACRREAEALGAMALLLRTRSRPPMPPRMKEALLWAMRVRQPI